MKSLSIQSATSAHSKQVRFFLVIIIYFLIKDYRLSLQVQYFHYKDKTVVRELWESYIQNGNPYNSKTAIHTEPTSKSLEDKFTITLNENKRSSIWWLCLHWGHRKLSLQQLRVPPVRTKLSNWLPLFSVIDIECCNIYWNLFSDIIRLVIFPTLRIMC